MTEEINHDAVNPVEEENPTLAEVAESLGFPKGASLKKMKEAADDLENKDTTSKEDLIKKYHLRPNASWDEIAKARREADGLPPEPESYTADNKAA
jgi:hypothetical protein